MIWSTLQKIDGFKCLYELERWIHIHITILYRWKLLYKATHIICNTNFTMYQPVVNLFLCLRQYWEPLKLAAIKALEWRQIDSCFTSNPVAPYMQFSLFPSYSKTLHIAGGNCSPSNQVFSLTSESILNGKSSHFVNFPVYQFPLGQFPYLVNVDKVGIDKV